jgi:hypothetical protein
LPEVAAPVVTAPSVAVVPLIVAVVHWMAPESSTMPILSPVAKPVAEVSETDGAGGGVSR